MRYESGFVSDDDKGFVTICLPNDIVCFKVGISDLLDGQALYENYLEHAVHISSVAQEEGKYEKWDFEDGTRSNPVRLN